MMTDLEENRHNNNARKQKLERLGVKENGIQLAAIRDQQTKKYSQIGNLNFSLAENTEEREPIIIETAVALLSVAEEYPDMASEGDYHSKEENEETGPPVFIPIAEECY